MKVAVALCPLNHGKYSKELNDKVRLQVIEGLDFEVNDGEFVAIVGPSDAARPRC
jgi:ABC-type nitrate/sulfonate/bicarbonate transport system ATPase subunit